MLNKIQSMLVRYIPEAIKFNASGIPLWVPLDDKKSSFEVYFQARNKPVAKSKAYVKYMIALLPAEESSAMTNSLWMW